GGGEPVHAEVLERLLHLVEPVGFDDRDDELHGAPEGVERPSLAREPRARVDPAHSPEAFLRGAAFFVAVARLAAVFLAAGRFAPLRLAPPADGVLSFAAATEAPASFFSTICSIASRYASVNASGFQGSVRLSISERAMSTSFSRTFSSAGTVSNSAARTSSGQYIVSRTNTSSLNRSADRCSLSRKLTFAIPTL